MDIDKFLYNLFSVKDKHLSIPPCLPMTESVYLLQIQVAHPVEVRITRWLFLCCVLLLFY